MLKRYWLTVICTLCVIMSTKAQYKFPPVDASTADIAYFPNDAAHARKVPQIRVIYSRPLKKGRVIFGDTIGLQRYGKVWRVGANEETEIKFYTPVIVGGKKVPAGTYGLFAIPNKDSWIIIINSNLDKWGLYYDSDKFADKDLVRFQVPVKSLDNTVEALSILFLPGADSTSANMVIGWDKTAVEVPIVFDK